jgi:hypothetical protein
MMEVKLATTSVLICLAATVHPQEKPPQLLLCAAQCLAVKNFLPLSRGTTLTFGYLLDEKSYLGEKVIYLVNYSVPS